MRKLSISILAVIFSLGAAFSQPVTDLGIVPIGVTLNSILRLNVTSGGNIEYVVNTIAQYTAGIGPNAAYQTQFTVSSSVDFDVAFYADDTDLRGVDNGGTIALDNLGYIVTGGSDAANLPGAGARVAFDDDPTYEIVNAVNANAGSPATNTFVIAWELGTIPSGDGTLLAQSITSDRYVINAIIDLYPHN